jgi:hypothetical protein
MIMTTQDCLELLFAGVGMGVLIGGAVVLYFTRPRRYAKGRFIK